MKFQIHFPSAFFVWGNDLRHAFPVHGSYDLSTIEGIQKTTNRYAGIGLGFLFVGKTLGLTLWKKNFQEFYIGRKITHKNPIPKTRAVSTLYCNLWWQSIADAELYGTLCREQNLKNERLNIPCSAGVYTIQDYDLESKFSAHLKENINLTGVYSYIYKISDPIPEKYYNPYYDMNASAGQVIQYYMTQYNIKDLSHIAGLIFSETENYHPNGWMGNTPDITPEYPVAQLEFDRPAYPIALTLDSLIIKLLLNGGKIQDSFRELASNYFIHILKHGYSEQSDKLDFSKELAEEFIKKL